jgi:hypothetical protein
MAADSAFAAGDIERADSLYYIGVRERPRDPLIREALGRYLAARGATKVAVVLLEESRMFGGDPGRIAGLLVPLYQLLGDWRALLTLPGSALGDSERRRAAWLAEHPFGVRTDSAVVSLIGAPKGDTIARIAVRIGGRAAVANILGTDAGLTIGARIAGAEVRRFGSDSGIATVDSLSFGSLRLVNVPATIGGAPSSVTIGVAAFNRMLVTIDYARDRASFTRATGGSPESRAVLVREAGQLRVLERGRWFGLSEFAAAVARARRAITIDLRAGEVRVRTPPPA